MYRLGGKKKQGVFREPKGVYLKRRRSEAGKRHGGTGKDGGAGQGNVDVSPVTVAGVPQPFMLPMLPLVDGQEIAGTAESQIEEPQRDR